MAEYIEREALIKELNNIALDIFYSTKEEAEQALEQIRAST